MNDKMKNIISIFLHLDINQIVYLLRYDNPKIMFYIIFGFSASSKDFITK